MTKENKILAIGLGVVIFIAAFIGTTVTVVHFTGSDTPVYGVSNPLGLNMQTYTQTYDADTQYIGKCSIVTPPKADPCDAAQGAIRYSFFQNVVNASQFKTWKSQNPGEYSRLTAHMQNPLCGSPVGLPVDMLTYYGSFLANAVEAYACALGTEPIAWPAPNPALDPKRKDKQPPTPPSGLTVNP